MPTRHAYYRLVCALRQNTDLLSHHRIGHRVEFDVVSVLCAAALLAEHESSWERPPESFVCPKGMSLANQWILFVEHLMQAYPCPRFLSMAWLRDDLQPRWRAFHLHLAAGRSARRFPLPDGTYCNKATARFLMQAPDDATPGEAFRWAQLQSIACQLGIEVAPRLARQLMRRLPLTDDSDLEVFWQDTIRFLIGNPLGEDEVNSIIEMCRSIRCMAAEKVFEGIRQSEPLDPTFSLHGRSVMSVRRLVTNWKDIYFRRIVRNAFRPPKNLPDQRAWIREGIEDFEHTINESESWVIVQLVTAHELLIEGRILSHCVGTYVQNCMQGHSSIWSLRHYDGSTTRRKITIQVAGRRREIIFAAGTRNRAPTEREKSIIRRWAQQAGLGIYENAMSH